MSTNLITIILLLLVTFIYFLFVKPIKKINRLAKQFERNGYKVFKFPYNPLKVPFLMTMLEDGRNGDMYYTYKTKFVPYDVLVGNRFTQPAVMALSPEARK
jgi:hypothetical protein